MKTYERRTPGIAWLYPCVILAILIGTGCRSNLKSVTPEEPPPPAAVVAQGDEAAERAGGRRRPQQGAGFQFQGGEHAHGCLFDTSNDAEVRVGKP